jgi:hypothetical protein
MTKHTARESWLREAAKLMKSRFDNISCPVPEDFHVSVGFKPAGGYESAIVMGCCYIRDVSSAHVNEIFISPEWDEPIEVLATFAHELIHAASDCLDGHGPGFRKYAVAFGLTGKMTATYAGPELRKYLAGVAKRLGPYPHSKTNIFTTTRRIGAPAPAPEAPKPRVKAPVEPTPEPTPEDSPTIGRIHSGRGKQPTLRLKVTCAEQGCDFHCRATATNLALGMPEHCGAPMECPEYDMLIAKKHGLQPA